MKKTIYTLATILCLLTIAIGSTCLFIGTPQQQSCNHCTKQTPIQQPVTTCCTSHHQPSSTTASVRTEQPTASAFAASDLPLATLVTVRLPGSRSASPPPIPRLIALRI